MVQYLKGITSLLEIMKEAKIINIEEVDDEPDKTYYSISNDLSYAKDFGGFKQDFIEQIVGNMGHKC